MLVKKQTIPLSFYLNMTVSLIIFLYLFFGQYITDKFPPPLPSGSDKVQFNKQLWIKNKLEHSIQLTVRQEMLQDTVKKFPGKNRKELIELLGSKHAPYSFDNSSNTLKYYLGGSRNISPGEEWLFIWFDKNGIFEKYQIITLNA